MTRTRVGTPGLLARHLAAGGALSLLLPMLVGVAAFTVALAPRALAQVSTDEIRAGLAAESPLLVDLAGTGRLGIPFQDPSLDVEFLAGSSDEAIQEFRAGLPEPLRSATGPVRWLLRTLPEPASAPDVPVEPTLSLGIALAWEDRVEIVEGRAPAGWTRPAPRGVGLSAEPAEPDELELIEVALSRASALAIGVGVGDVLDFRPAPIEIAALYEPVDPDDAYWVHFSDLATPVITPDDRGGTAVRAGALLAPESFPALAEEFAVGELDAWMPIDPTAISDATAAEAQEQARLVATRTATLPLAGELSFRGGLADLLERAGDRVATMASLIALGVSGLAGVLIAVLALAVRSVLDRRAPALRLSAARGASGAQLRGAMMLEALLLCAPAAVLGAVAAALLLPAEVAASALIAPAAVALVPVVLIGALTSSSPTAPRRTDPVGPSAGRPRLVIELAVAGLAALALLLLDRRGLVGPSAAVGIDPLLSATPLLLAVAACLVVLRLSPLALRGVQRLVRRRTDPTAVLGAARAIREPALGFATALALVVGVSVVVFATVMTTTVRAGLDEAALDAVGADARLTARVVDESTVTAVEALDGVDAAVALSTTADAPFVDAVAGRSATLVVADGAALALVRPDLPALPSASAPDGRLPVLVSDDWRALPRGTEAQLGEAAVVVVGVVDAEALPGLGPEWVMVDASAAERSGIGLADPGVLLVGMAPGADAAPLAERAAEIVRDAPGAGAVGVAVLATTMEAARTPIVAGLDAALAIAAGASLVLMMATVVLATTAAAAARNRLLGILRVIGMSTAQLRRVVAWELGPLAVVAILVGTALGTALPALVTGALDLRLFLGGDAAPRAVVEPVPVLIVLGLFALVVVIAAALALAIGRRLAPAGLLRMGDTA